MFNKRNTWIVVDTVTILIGSVTHSLFNFLLWEQGKSLELLLKYNLILFISLGVGTILGGVVSKLMNVKISYMFSLLASAATAYYALLDLDNFQNNILIFGILWGLNWGLVYIARSIITELIVPLNDMVKFNSLKTIVSTVVTLSVPLIINLAINKIGYRNSLTISFIAYFAVFVLLIFIDIKQTKQRFMIFKMIIELSSVQAIRKIAIINLSLGLVYSFGWGVMDIVILEQIGSLTGWTYVSLSTAVLGLGLVRLLGKVDIEKGDKTRSIISFSAMLFAVGSLFLALNFSISFFVVFVILKLFFDKTMGVVGGAYLTHEMNKDIDYQEKKLSYQVFSQTLSAIGRVIPIAMLLLLPGKFLNTTTIITLLAVINFLPFFFIKAYQIRYGVFGTR